MSPRLSSVVMNASAYPDARLHSLHCYPVKSGRVIDLQSARLGPLGLQHDRSWLIVDAADRFITQRSHPTLARLVALPDADGGLSLTHPEAGALQLSAPPALPDPPRPLPASVRFRPCHAA